MTIQQWLNNPDFLEKDQFDKRKILKKSILTDNKCYVGINVMCFDISHYNSSIRYNFNNNDVVKLTICKSYKILSHKKGNIKILNDDGKKVWCTINRFIYSINYERKEKLKKLKKSDGDNEKNLICVLCGQEWGKYNPFTNICENDDCNGFCTWGYDAMKPESYTVDKNGFWKLKPVSKTIKEI